MWPSQRLASIGLKSWQGPVQARSRDRRGIRPIVTLLEERALLSTVPITVTSLADSGPGTLRAAITTADSGSASNQYAISFASSLSGTINLTEALPNLSNNISITGPGTPTSLTVNRVSTAADFSIFTVNSGETVSISMLTIAGAQTASDPNGLFYGLPLSAGGGVDNMGNLSVTNVIFNANTSTYGGAICNHNGVLVLSNSILTSNASSNGDGGAIYNDGTVTITNDIFTSNTAQDDGNGGAITNDSGPLTVIGSTFSNNIAAIGSCIYNHVGPAVIIGSTFTNNPAAPGGAGSVIANGSELHIINSTIASNGGEGIDDEFDSYNQMVVTNCTIIDNEIGIVTNGSSPINNSIIAGNTGGRIGGVVGNDILGVFDGNYDIIGNNTGISSTTGTGDQIGTAANPINPDLGPLQNNGGPTQTMAILLGSPAIGTGSVTLAVDQNGASLATEQRGTGYPRTTNGYVDIGAYEFTPLAQTVTFGTLANQTYGVAPITLHATDTSNLPITYSVISGPATVSGNTLTITGAGTVTVAASAVGNAEYNPADPVDESFTVARATPIISVTPYNVVYTGTAHSATGNATGVGGVNLSSDLTINSTHTNAEIYPDTWSFTDPTGNYASETGTMTDTIGQATATILVTPTPGLIYNGGPQVTATGTATGVGGVNLRSDLTINSTHTNAEIYPDTWSFTDPTGNYASETGTMTDTIGQATATILVTPTPGLIYNGGPQVTATGTATGVGGVNLSSDLTINSTHTNAEIYPDTWSFTDPTGNYASETGTMTDTIGQATATILVTPTPGLIYNGGPQVTATGTATGVGGVNLRSDLTINSTHTNAEIYPDTWSFTDPTGNYASETGTMTDTIGQATATILVTPTPGLIYNGGPQVTATGTATGVGGVNLRSDLTINSTHTNAEIYPDTWSFTDPTGNYASETGTMTDTIGQATATILVTPTPGLIYNGGPQVTATGTATGVGGVNLRSDLTINSTHTNAEIYPDTWSFTDPTGNYASETGTMTDTIGQATATILVTPTPGLVYNGSPQETASYSAIGVSGAIALPTSDFTDTTVHTAAGTSTDTWTFTDPNYASQSGAVTDTVGQANAMIVVTPTTGLVYNGSPQVTAAMSTLYGVTICDSIGFGIDHDLTVNATHTDAGTYADSWSFTDPTGNYAPQSGTMTDTIGQANVTVAVTPTNGTVYGTAPTFAGTITGQVAAGNPDNLLWTATLEENPFVFDGGNGYGLPSYSASGNLVVGTYTVQAGLVGNNLDNYSVTYVNSSLTVTPAPIIGHFTVANKVYDGTTSVGPIMTSQTTSLTGVLPGDSVNLMMWGAKFSSPNVGTWTVTPGATSTYLLSGDTVDYSLQSVDSTTATITPANATINILGYVAPYDGKAHTATGTVTGVYVVDLDTTVPPFGTIQQLPSSDLTISSTHTNAGIYTDTWTFSDPSGNYLPQSGTMIDAISKANAAVKVTPYNVTYDGQSHSATGSATGVNSTNLASDLTITSAHTNAGTYGDSWSFTDPNYVAQSGTMTDVISKANATVRVMGYNVNYNAVVHSAAGTVTGVNGALPNYDLIISSSHTNAGVYGDTWTFNDPNYVTQSGKFTDVIGKANVTVKLAPYNVTYNGAWHVASGTAVGVNGQALPGLNLGYTWHINAGVYRDAWYFTDTTGNYNNASGLVTDIIGKANARIIVNAYNVLFDGGAHYSTGIVIGVYGQALPGLNLAYTVHLGGYYTNNFYDRWTFTDTTGNYNSTSGIIINTIRANQPLYKALYNPFYPRSPFYGRLFMW